MTQKQIFLLDFKFCIVLFEIFVIDIQFCLISELKFPNFFPNFFAKILRVQKFWIFPKNFWTSKIKLFRNSKKQKVWKFLSNSGTGSIRPYFIWHIPTDPIPVSLIPFNYGLLESISSTFYVSNFCTKVLFCQNPFSKLSQSVTRKICAIIFRSKNSPIKCWWNRYIIL